VLVTNFTLKYVLYRLVLAGYQLLDIGRMHPLRERSLRALAASTDYIDQHMPDALAFETQKELLTHSVRRAQVSGHFLEFGVFSGGTIRQVAKLRPDVTVHGFDSFEGLPQAWGGFSLGNKAFSRDGKLPRVPANVVLHKGWFSETVPAWLAAVSGPIAFIHVDCDLYSSTVDIFNLLGTRLQPGTVIVFDEYFNYPGWERHEFRAWHEFVDAAAIEYDYVGYARQQVTVCIRRIGGG